MGKVYLSWMECVAPTACLQNKFWCCNSFLFNCLRRVCGSWFRCWYRAEIVGQYHDRMPVILEKELEEEWLNSDLVEVKRISNMLKPYSSEKMEEWRVGDEARNPKNDYPEVMKPIRSEDGV
jgi:hypothetical protein